VDCKAQKKTNTVYVISLPASDTLPGSFVRYKSVINKSITYWLTDLPTSS